MKVYFFTSPECSENSSYIIGFGFGNPNVNIQEMFLISGFQGKSLY
jgi:hypothetical protein